MCVCVCAPSRFSCVPLFATLWTIAGQAPLSRGFFGQAPGRCRQVVGKALSNSAGGWGAGGAVGPGGDPHPGRIWATRVSWSPLSGLKGVQPPLPFGERTRDCSPGHWEGEWSNTGRGSSEMQSLGRKYRPASVREMLSPVRATAGAVTWSVSGGDDAQPRESDRRCCDVECEWWRRCSAP